MATLTNVFSAHVSATGTLYNGATNLAGYQANAGGTAGDIVFRDGGVSGTVLLTLSISNNNAISTLQLPGNGIRFTKDIHVTLPTGASITVFCG